MKILMMDILSRGIQMCLYHITRFASSSRLMGLPWWWFEHFESLLPLKYSVICKQTLRVWDCQRTLHSFGLAPLHPQSIVPVLMAGSSLSNKQGLPLYVEKKSSHPLFPATYLEDFENLGEILK